MPAESKVALHPSSQVTPQYLLRRNLSEVDEIEGIVIVRVKRNGVLDVQFSKMDSGKVALASLKLQQSLLTS